MKHFFSLRMYLLLLVACVSNLALAQDGTYSFSVREGTVSVTPAWCIQYPCPTTVARMSGTFEATISDDGRNILFTASSIETKPDVSFKLPYDPNEDGGGVTREFAFTFTGDAIKGKGIVDSRAFDGPLVEYMFVADVDDSGFYTARPDFRKCAFPFCGGYFIRAVNQRFMQCADGSIQRECYIAELIYGTGPVEASYSVGNETPLLVRGHQGKKDYGSKVPMGVFYADAAYRSATQVTATQSFYGIENNGILCITTPCFSYDSALLNTERSLSLSEVNLETSGATPRDIELAQQLLANGQVLYAAGVNRKYKGFAGTGVAFIAQQFYLPLKRSTICPEGSRDTEEICRTAQ